MIAEPAALSHQPAQAHQKPHRPVSGCDSGPMTVSAAPARRHLDRNPQTSDGRSLRGARQHLVFSSSSAFSRLPQILRAAMLDFPPIMAAPANRPGFMVHPLGDGF
jgi:hypothetical protein